MSEHGPYNQPPQNPYGGGDGTGGQPPYGPGTGGQPGYGQGPYPGNPGQDHGMYAGGQPPYGGPGGPVGPGGPGAPGGYPPPQPPQGGGGGKAGLWVVIGGGAIIVVLVIAVIIMLVTRGNSGEEIATGPDETTQTTEETDDEPADDDTEQPQTGGGDGPSGEPPYALPIEPCEAFTEQVAEDFGLSGDPRKSVSDSRSSCTGSTDTPEGNDSSAYGSLSLDYSVPYGGSDSIEGATTDFQRSVDRYTGGNDDYYPSDSIEEDKAIEGLGDEAHLVVTEYDFLDDLIPMAVIMVRVGNMNVEISYQINSIGEREGLVMVDDIEPMLVTAAEEAVGIIGDE